MTPTRRLAAILAADVVGYSRLVGANEQSALATLARLKADIIEPNIGKHAGRLFKVMGDGFLAEFASAVQAVTCAIAIQEDAETTAAALPEAQGMRLRIGVHVGDVMVEGDDLLGDGVNIASRLEGIAEPGGVSISRTVHDQVRDRIEVGFVDKGEVTLKNIVRPVQVFAISAALSQLAVPATPLPLPDKPSIAVLPFQNMSGDPEQEYFADGMVEDIITALSRFKSLFVIARNSSFSYKGKSPDIRQVGRELGVRYVLEGSVRKAGNRVRITGQLIDAANANHLWADRFDGPVEDIFDLQDQVTERVVGAISPALLRAETDRSALKRPDSLVAYDLYLRALSELNRFAPEHIREALRLSYQAIATEPTYATVYALGAFCYGMLYVSNLLTNDEIETAKAEGLRLAERAIALASDDAEVLARSAQPISNLSGRIDRAIELVNRALSINPNFAFAWNLSGWTHIFAGFPDVGLEHLGRSLRLSPADGRRPIMLHGMATANLLLGNYTDALDWAKKLYFEGSGLNPSALWTLAACAAFAGDRSLSEDAVQQLQTKRPNTTLGSVRQYYQLIRWRRQQDVDRMIDGLRLAGLPE